MYPAGCFGKGSDVFFNKIIDPSKTSPELDYQGLCIGQGILVYILMLICESNFISIPAIPIPHLSPILYFKGVVLINTFRQLVNKEKCHRALKWLKTDFVKDFGRSLNIILQHLGVIIILQEKLRITASSLVVFALVRD